MANGNPRRTIQPVTAKTQRGKLRDRFGAAHLQTLSRFGTRGAQPGNKFLKPGWGPAANKVLRGELDRLPDRAFFTEEEVFAKQKQKLDAMGFTLEELNTPVLKPNGQPFMIGLGNDQIPAVMGDLLLGARDEPFDNEVAGDVRREFAKAKQAGQPLTTLVADKFGGRKDTIVGLDAQGNKKVLNVQTQGTEAASKILNKVVPAVSLAAIGGLGAFGPGGFLTGAPAAAGPAAPTGLAVQSAAPAAATTAASSGFVPTAATAAAKTAAGGGLQQVVSQLGQEGARQAGGGFLQSLLSSNALPAIATTAGGLLAANQARRAGDTAADAQEQAAQTTAQLQQDIANRAQQEQLRQEQRLEPFRQAALGALPDLQEAARARPDQFQIDPNLLQNLPDVPGFTAPDLTQLNQVISELRAGPSTELSPQGRAAIDIGTRTALRNAAAGGFRGSGNLLAELQQLGTEQASLDFSRQEQQRQSRLASAIDALSNVAQLEAGTEQDRMNAALLQRNLERQSRLDPITLQQMNREMQSQDQANQFNRLAQLAQFAPNTPQIVSGNLSNLSQLGQNVAGFQSAAGDAQAAGQLGLANTLFNTFNNLSQQFGQNTQQNNLLSLLRQQGGLNMQNAQLPANNNAQPGFQSVTKQIQQPNFGAFSPIQSGQEFIGSQAQSAIPNRMLI